MAICISSIRLYYNLERWRIQIFLSEVTLEVIKLWPKCILPTNPCPIYIFFFINWLIFCADGVIRICYSLFFAFILEVIAQFI